MTGFGTRGARETALQTNTSSPASVMNYSAAACPLFL